MENETFDESEAIGMTRQDAETFFANKGYRMRVTKRDGQATIGTRDYRLDRINVFTVEGKVTEIHGVG